METVMLIGVIVALYGPLLIPAESKRDIFSSWNVFTFKLKVKRTLQKGKGGKIKIPVEVCEIKGLLDHMIFLAATRGAEATIRGNCLEIKTPFRWIALALKEAWETLSKEHLKEIVNIASLAHKEMQQAKALRAQSTLAGELEARTLKTTDPNKVSEQEHEYVTRFKHTLSSHQAIVIEAVLNYGTIIRQFNTRKLIHWHGKGSYSFLLQHAWGLADFTGCGAGYYIVHDDENSRWMTGDFTQFSDLELELCINHKVTNA